MRSFILIGIMAVSPLALQAQTLDSLSLSGAQAIAIAGGAGGSGESSGTQRVVTVPTTIAPSVYGANPCMVGGSGAVSVMGFGIGGGASVDGRECRDQEWFRFLNMAGQPRVANAYACAASEAVHAAYRAAGVPCLPGDLPPVTVATAPVQAAPTRIAAARPSYCSIPGIGNPECR